MKVGEKVEVTIRGHVVAHATIREMSDGVALLDFPATRVTMGYRTELEADAPVAESNAHEMLGVENALGQTEDVPDAGSDRSQGSEGNLDSPGEHDPSGNVSVQTVDNVGVPDNDSDTTGVEQDASNS